MISIGVQIHGYKKGHQLLASSINLSKEDQFVIDRLSDVAGPLRPKEQFEPYLTAYPLPSGKYYVFARTWQDLSVPRAGCVRTKSLIIDSIIWSKKIPLTPMLEFLNPINFPDECNELNFEINEHFESSVPPISGFNSNELVEAIFLEESKPIVVFDAPNPEHIAMRILEAMWPSIRKKYTLSTFALSPRKINGREFDLIFSPMNVKSRFSDWAGRRLDGKVPQSERHKWTKLIARNIFEEPTPYLLTENDLILFNENKINTLGGLRVALLWNELLEKLPQNPTVALGLLDIANSGIVTKNEAISLIEPKLVKAISTVENTMSYDDAWNFTIAIASKMKIYNISKGINEIKDLTSRLSMNDPRGALKILLQPDSKGITSSLIQSITNGLSRCDWYLVKEPLLNMPTEIIIQLIFQNSKLTKEIAEDVNFIPILKNILETNNQIDAQAVGITLLPYLVEDYQLPVALPIIKSFDIQKIISELHWLKKVNNFKSEKISTALIQQSNSIGGTYKVRDTLASFESSKKIKHLLLQTLNPVKDDLLWILDSSYLSNSDSLELLTNILTNADEKQFSSLFSNIQITERIISILTYKESDLLFKIATKNELPVELKVKVLRSIIDKIETNQIIDIAILLTEECLKIRFDEHINEIKTLSSLLGMIDGKIDYPTLVSKSLGQALSPNIASRNLITFEKAPISVRNNIISNIDKIANTLKNRGSLDLTEQANNSYSRLLLDAEESFPQAVSRASEILIPSLFNSRRLPVSSIVAVLFPIAYKKLATTDETPYSLRFLFSFFDWDRCLTVRKELVRAFMQSSIWKAGDLALTACRCGDELQFLKQIIKSYDGDEYLIKMKDDLNRLDKSNRKHMEKLINELRKTKFD
ncbi:hypothetical protein M5X66_11710 [Providencia sp. PROV188]|uniref:GAP1-N1 domain-containing protein n=1 Tax=Providencia sp. PROV188 TaxID=2939731 RepID=UPI0022DE930F|nr:hypothetical protein [Providencia sp. PROV188]WBM59661.1 hypothetical protein M5X66_11710 [Providencia sp. PROV188]